MKVTTSQLNPSLGPKRRGFTLVEMLVVILIIVILTAVVVPLALTFSQGSAVRDAARTVQAALAGARDRALSNQQPRGVRFLVDDTAPDRVRTLVFVRQQDPYSGTCHIVRSQTNPDSGDYRPRLPVLPAQQSDPSVPVDLVVAGPQVDFSQFDSASGGPGFGTIRFDQSGPLYSFQYLDRHHLQLTGSYPVLPVYRTDESDPTNLDEPNEFDDALRASVGINFTISRASVPLEDADPIALPNGVMVDVSGLSATAINTSGNEQQVPVNLGLSNLYMPSLIIQWNPAEEDIPVPYYEIMFAPNGQVIGEQKSRAHPHLCIWIRETLADVGNAYKLDSSGNRVKDSTNNDVTTRAVKLTSDPSQHSLVIVHGRTGFVSTVPPNFVPDTTDADNAEYYDTRQYYRNVARGMESGL